MNNDRITEVYFGETSSEDSTRQARQRVSWICSQVQGRRVLDLGCSQGVVSLLLAREGYRVIGLDREVPALTYAAAERRREPSRVRANWALSLGDGAALPFSAECFDCVILTEVLEHATDSAPILAEVARVLEPSGRLIVTCPLGLMPHPDHHQVFYPTNLLTQLEAHFGHEYIDIQESHYIRYVGRLGDSVTDPEEFHERSRHLTEERLLRKEERYWKELVSLRETLSQAQAKYRNATENVDRLKAKVQEQRWKSKALTHQLAVTEERLASGGGPEGESRPEGPGVKPAVAYLELASIRAEHRRLLEEREAWSQERQELVAESEDLRARLEASDRRRTEALEQIRSWRAQEEPREKEYAEEIQRLRKQVTVQRGLVGRHDRRIKDLALRLRVYERSKFFRLLRIYWRFRKEFLAGSRTERASFLAAVRDAVVRRMPWKRREEERQQLELDEYLKAVTNSSAPAFVFMFSGTTFIQEHRGNRPIRLSRVLLERKVPVLFSYWRWKKTERIPPASDPNLLQMPIDMTLERMNRIARHDYGDKKKIFVITFPHVSCARYVNVFNSQDWQTIYDVRDEWEEFHKVGAARWYDEGVERYIANNSDVVTAVSAPLQEKIGAYMEDGQVELSPNALDTRFPTGRKIRVRPVDGRKVIGYVGHLTAAWFDWPALIETARARPAWTIEIIGHSAPEELNLPKNLRYLGPKDYRGILKTAKRWRAALIPFKICALADGVDPIKVYEYLSMGLPVVSFRMPQIHDYPYVFIAHDRDQFISRIEEALKVEMDAQVIRDFLAENRWEDRVDGLLSWPHRKGHPPVAALCRVTRPATAESAAS